MHCECHCASLDSDNVDWMTLFTLVINLMKELLEMLSLVLQSDALQSGWITFSWRKLILIYSVAGCMPGWTMILITCTSRSSSSSSCCLVVISSESHQINSWLLMIDGDLLLTTDSKGVVWTLLQMTNQLALVRIWLSSGEYHHDRSQNIIMVAQFLAISGRSDNNIIYGVKRLKYY